MLKSMEANNLPLLEAEDISQGILYVLGTPPRVQVSNGTKKKKWFLFNELLKF
jgi:hypothetical protein